MYMCVCTRVCVYVCVYLCACMCMYVCVCVCVYVVLQCDENSVPHQGNMVDHIILSRSEVYGYILHKRVLAMELNQYPMNFIT